MSAEYDVIVIGSGMGGLTTASLLAQLKKAKVLVLERHFKAGGFTHTFNRQGHIFDVGLHYVGDMHQGSQTRKLFDYVCASGVDWQAMPDVFDKFVYPDFTFCVPSSQELYIEQLCQLFPTETSAIKQYFQDVETVSKAIEHRVTAGSMPTAIAAVMNATNFSFKKLATISTKEYLDSRFKDAKLKAVLTSQWPDYGLPPALSAFGMHGLLVSHYLKGGFYPKGSSSKIAGSIVPIIEKAGGKVLLNHTVEEILVENGTACGVTAKNHHGQSIKFTAHKIVSNAGAWTTFTKLLPQAQQLNKVPGINQESDISSISLYIGFKESLKNLGFAGENHWLYKHYDHDGLYNTRNNLENCPGFAFLSCASLRDEQATNHTAQLITLAGAEAFKQWQNSSWKKRGDTYEAEKKQLSNKLLNFVEERYPGFKDLIDFTELSTPLTVESFTGHPAGRIYGQPLTTEVMAQRSFRADTHVNNLFLTGSDVLAPGIAGAFMGGVFCAAKIIGVTGLPELFKELNASPKPLAPQTI
jgi:phytoene dehydrogenase-like protein